MIARSIPVELAQLARNVVDKIAHNIEARGPDVRSRLIASELYEALRVELNRTPRSEAAKIGLLAAAIDQCRRSANAAITPPLMLDELRATAALLESAMPALTSELLARRGFRVIEGGLSKTG